MGGRQAEGNEGGKDQDIHCGIEAYMRGENKGHQLNADCFHPLIFLSASFDVECAPLNSDSSIGMFGDESRVPIGQVGLCRICLPFL